MHIYYIKYKVNSQAFKERICELLNIFHILSVEQTKISINLFAENTQKEQTFQKYQTMILSTIIPESFSIMAHRQKNLPKKWL